MQQHDNDEDTFQPLGVAAERVVVKLDPRKLSVDAYRRDPISGGGFFGIPEYAETIAFAETLDGGAKDDIFRASIEGNSFVSAQRHLRYVRHILQPGSRTKIANPVVGLVTVDVVEFIRRLTEHIKPREAVPIQRQIINTNSDIATTVGSSLAPLEFSSSPVKFPGFRIIVEDLSEPLGRDGLSRRHTSKPNEEEKEESKDQKHTGQPCNEFLENRLREIERFERRAAGLIPHRSRRQRE